MVTNFIDLILDAANVILAIAAVCVLFLIGEQLGDILLRYVERKHRR